MPQFRIGTSTRSVNGRIRRFPVWRPNSSPGARSQAADAIAYGHRFAQTGITFRSVIGIAYKTPIRNRHSEALVDNNCRGDRTPFSSRKSIVSVTEISIPAGDSRFFAATSPGSRGCAEVEGRIFFRIGPSRRSTVAVDAARRLLPAS